MKDEYIKLYLKLGGNLEQFNSRKQRTILTKHAIRKYLYKKYKITYEQIAEIEYQIAGVKPHYSTIIHSVNDAYIPLWWHKKWEEAVDITPTDQLITFINERSKGRSKQYMRELIDKYFIVKVRK